MALICSETLLFILQFGTRADAKVSEKNAPSTRKLHERPREGTESPAGHGWIVFHLAQRGLLLPLCGAVVTKQRIFVSVTGRELGSVPPAQIPVGCLQYLFAWRLLQRPDFPPGCAACTAAAQVDYSAGFMHCRLI